MLDPNLKKKLDWWFLPTDRAGLIGNLLLETGDDFLLETSTPLDPHYIVLE